MSAVEGTRQPTMMLSGASMSKDKVTRFPIESVGANRLGKRAVPCIVTSRWLQLPEKADNRSDGHYMFVDVMTTPDGETRAKLCTLCISKEDLRAALKEVA